MSDKPIGYLLDGQFYKTMQFHKDGGAYEGQTPVAGVPPELFAQQIEAAMRYADAPLSHDRFVTLVLHLNARCAA